MTQDTQGHIEKHRQLHPPLRVVIVGHVDHGKSTLIGRLLYDTDSLPDGKFEEIEKVCRDRGIDLEFSYLLDAFQAERDQAITIDTTQIWFKTRKRDYVIIDAPGHREFLKNMISGAAAADAAILVVDADEGVQEQTRRHAYLLHLLGLRQVVVVINKMDKVDYDANRFNEVSKQITDYLEQFGLTPSSILPISARQGEMIARHGEHMDWFKGRTLLETLDHFDHHLPPVALPLRFPVQDVYRIEEKRILVGRVESGKLTKGDTLLFSPTNETATVTSVEVWPEDKSKIAAQAGEAIGITLDKPIFVERGHTASHDEGAPMLSNVFKANIFWISDAPLKVGNTYKLRCGPMETKVNVQSIDKVINTDDLAGKSETAEVPKNAVAEVTLRARQQIAVDSFGDNPKTGRIALYEGYDIAGGGILSMEGYPDQRRKTEPKAQNIHKVSHLLRPEERAIRNGHQGSVVWLTGLSGSGKSTLAMMVERELFEKGYQVFVLDGDNVRHGLNSDLGFSPEDRTENIRRIGEVAALMAKAGMVVITAFISPYKADRKIARAASPDNFHEIYVQADLETCENRDPKGLYKKARDGEIKDFTGIDAPYEAPANPELVVDTENNDVDFCVQQIFDYISESIVYVADKDGNDKDSKSKAIAL